MKVTIEKSEARGRVAAPPSKSCTHRALMCASMAKGKSKIIFPLDCDDVEATVDVLRACGVKFGKNGKQFEVEGGVFSSPSEELYCRESGTTLRFMTAFCSLVGRSRLTCGSSLLKRPIGPLVDSLRQLGVRCKCADGYPPVEIEKRGIEGGKTTLLGDISSQFISALLLVSPFTPKTAICLTTPLESKPYVLMTLEMQRKFGIEISLSDEMQNFLIHQQRYNPAVVPIEGDWSSASFLLAAGALTGKLEVRNLNFGSLQADKVIGEILKSMGARIKINREKKSVAIDKSELRGIEIDVSNCPDLFPVICVLAANAKGISRITGIKRLRIKESDRVELMRKGLERMGAEVKEEDGEVIIKGMSSLSGATIDPERDHRIAMAFAVLGLVAEGETLIKNAECVAKSFPGFWDKLKELNCEVVKSE